MVVNKPMSLRPHEAQTGSNGRSKLAATIAFQIVDDVIDRGWPVGEAIGSESDLLQRYGVSRAVLREAIRLVEHQQVARMRRGLGRGLVITEPSITGIIDAVVFYLYRLDVRVEQIFSARVLLEDCAVSLAPSRLDDSQIEAIRARLSDEHAGDVDVATRGFHSLLASAAKNRVLTLFVEVLTKVCDLYIFDRRQITQEERKIVRIAHERVAHAIISGDTATAQYYMRKHLEAESAYFASRRRRAPDLLRSTTTRDGEKLAEDIARKMFQDVISRGLEPGDVISSEAELVDTHGASRAVVRQAVRLLELHQVAEMRRGRAGGLFVLPPNVDAISQIMAVYLEYQRVTPKELFEVRSSLEVGVVDLVIDHLDLDTPVVLQDALLNEMQSSEDEEFSLAAHDIHAVLGSLSSNPVLELLVSVLIQLSHMHEAAIGASRRREVRREVDRTHAGIVEAILASDHGLARRRMQRHLDALGEYML